LGQSILATVAIQTALKERAGSLKIIGAVFGLFFSTGRLSTTDVPKPVVRCALQEYIKKLRMKLKQ
jgi:hypothetical protein